MLKQRRPVISGTPGAAGLAAAASVHLEPFQVSANMSQGTLPLGENDE